MDTREITRTARNTMARYLVTWKAVNARFSDNKETKLKQQTSFTELVQQALKSGALKDWGCSPDAQKGYAVFEGTETVAGQMASMYIPFFEFDILPVLTADQLMEVLKSA